MRVTAKLSYLRIAPRKVRLVADLIRRKKVPEAQNILNFTVKRGAQPLLKLLNSAVANAKNNFQIEPANLYIFKIAVNEGPKLKRWRARARGQAYEIQKKTSHVALVLEEITPSKKIKKVKKREKISPVLEEKKKEVSEVVSVLPSKKKEREAFDKIEKQKAKLETGKPKIKTKRGFIKRIFQRKAF